MRLVSAAKPTRLSTVVATQYGPDQGLVLAHADGTVSHFDERLQLVSVWLNPGRRVSCLAALDRRLFMAFEDSTARLVSLETGVTITSVNLPARITGLAVFEHLVVGWNRDTTELHLMHRFNFEIFQTLNTSTFVVNVFAVSNGIGVATSSDLYLLCPMAPISYSLKSIFHTSEFLIVGAARFGTKWCILTPHNWKLLGRTEGSESLGEEIEVQAPLDTLPRSIVSTPSSTIIQCTNGMYIYIRENNIQAVASPASDHADPHARDPVKSEHAMEHLVPNTAWLVTSDLRVFQPCLIKGQLEWQPLDLPVETAEQAWLLENDDPVVTAVCGSYVGTEDGKVNGVAVFPGPVLHIDDSWAYSQYGKVKLPLASVNIVQKTPSLSYADPRVTTRISKFNLQEHTDGSWVGISDNGCVSLQRASDEAMPACLAVLLVTQGIKRLEECLATMDTSLRGVAHLEDLAVLAVERGDDALLQAVAQILSQIWESQRVEELLRAAHPRSLTVIASMFGFSDMPAAAIARIVRELAESGDVESCYAVAWVFEHRQDAVDSLNIPFTALAHLPDTRLAQFAYKLAHTPAGMSKLLQDSTATLMEIYSDGGAGSSEDELRAQQRMAVRLLLEALELPAPLALPQTEAQLLQIVQTVVSVIHRKAIGAKSVLVKLLAMHQVQFHQGRQLLLVPTIQSRHAGLIIDMDSGAKGRQMELEKPPNADAAAESLALAFSADGKAVYGTLGTKRYAWYLPGALRSLFRSESSVEPVEVR